MGIKRIGYGDKYKSPDYSEYICDTEDDLELLPTSETESIVNLVVHPKCSIGSQATVISTHTVYILNTQNVWTKFITYASSGGRSSDETADGNG